MIGPVRDGDTRTDRDKPRLYAMLGLRPDRHGDGDVTVVTLVGAVDVFTAPRLRDLLVELIGSGLVRLVVDVDRAVFIDPTALAVLVGAWRRVRDRGGCLALAGASERIRHAFRAASLTGTLAPYETVDRAVRACRAGLT